MDSMIVKLDLAEQRYQELERLMASLEVATDYVQFQSLAKECASLEEVVNIYREYLKRLRIKEDAQALLEDSSDTEMVSLATEELSLVNEALEGLVNKMKLSLLPKDVNDERDVIVEIRAGTGGQEASLFAADLFRMYTRYASLKGWEVELLDSNASDLGGFKEIVFEVRGQNTFSHLKHERGVHRVQRVPATESSGRIHTSTTTVAVLPQVDEVKIKINPSDLRIDIFHAGGHGGQNVNKVATAVRIVHAPTGFVAVCQDERSQFKNKQKAMAILRARIHEAEQRRQESEIVEERRSQVGSGERSEKIRTYNYPQDRVTDHRISMSIHGIERLMDGELAPLLDALSSHEQASLLEASLA